MTGPAARHGRAQLTLRSAAPDRERWQLEGLRRRPHLARALERLLARCPGVRQATASELTGRVLLVLDPARPARDTAQLLLDALRQIAADALGDAPAPAPGAAEPAPPSSPAAAAAAPRALLELVRGSEDARGARREVLALSVAHTTFKIATPLVQGLIMSSVIIGGLPFLTRLGLGLGHQIAALSGAYFASAALEKSLEHRRKTAWTAYAGSIEQALRLRAFRHVQELDLATLAEQELSTLALTNLIKDDVQRVTRFVEVGAPTLLDKTLTFATCGVFLLASSPVAFVLALAPLPFILKLSRRNHRESHDRMRAVEQRERELDSMLANTLHGLSTVKSFTAEPWERARLLEVNRAYLARHGEAAAIQSKLHGGIDFGIYSGIVLPIIYSSYQVYQHKLSFMSYTLRCFVLPLLIFATQGLDQVFGQYREATRAAHRLDYLFALRAPPRAGAPLDPRAVRGELALEAVSFRYPSRAPGARGGARADGDGGARADGDGDGGAPSGGAEPSRRDAEPPAVLTRLTVQIPAGSCTAFVGTSGSGKSTLVKLLQRLYEPDEGRVLLDGADVRGLDVHDLRRAIAWVSQDVYLFEGSIYDNIRYGDLSAGRERIWAAARAAQALEFIEAQPGGFDAPVGERGQNLSGGQRQRISIARALVKDAPILILDEATSAMDNRTEACIAEAVRRAYAGRTILVIAHRLSLVRDVDRIYLLEQGQVREAGTHDELLARDGGYAQLWRLQVQEGAATAASPLARAIAPGRGGEDLALGRGG